ncbi:MAG: TolC family protein [Rhodocyclaceae bacterium]|nr:TolC family protein [Rhodocyclaceae bacterium]
MLRCAPSIFLAFALCTLGAAHAADGMPLTLRGAVDRALEVNRDIRQAAAAVSGAEAGMRIAGTRPNASLSIDSSKARPNHGIGINRQDSIVRFEQTFERGDKRELRLAQAGALRDAAQADRADTRRQIRAAVAVVYWRLKATETALALAEADSQGYGRLVDVSRLRLANGDLSGTDLARVEAEAARASTEADLLHTQRRDLQTDLARLIAAEANAGALLAADDWPLPAAEPPADTEAVVERRPDVAAARARLDAAGRQVELARAQRTRDVTLGVQLERDEFAVSSVGVGVRIPIFTGNDFAGDSAAAGAGQTSAEIALEQVRAAAAADLDRLRVRLEVTGAAAHKYRQDIVPRTERATEGVRYAYENGAASLLDLLDALRSQRSVRRAAADAYANHAAALAEWRAAIDQDLP